MNATRAVIGRCPWSIRVQIHGWRHGKLVFFVLFNMARGFENVCEIISDWGKWKLRKKFSRSYLQRRKMEKRRPKKLLTTWQCLNYKKSSQQLPSCVFATRDSLFCKMFSLLFFFEQEKTVKNFSKKLYTSKLKKSKAVWGRYVYRSFFFSDHSIKQIDSMFPCVCSVINHRGRQNVVKTSLTHSPAARVPSLFLPHFDVICDLLG